jgi:glycosyltransferase involved in cell wall biosynthesis
MHSPTPTISLCMIVKDEEKFLENCLKSVENCVDEMVIVDTGSTDRTIEIAKSFGARVYQHPWENDFSKHRNQSLSYARGDWMFWIDADEVLESGGGEIIRKAVRNNGIDSLLVTMVCYYENRTRESWNNSIKLFKKNAGILFEGSVHNQVVGCQRTKYCSAKIYHYGYDLDPNNVQKKFDRTSTLLKRAIEKEPDNFLHHHNLAVSYSSVRLFQKAVKQGLMAIELYKKTNDTDPNILWTYFVVAASYFNLKMIGEAKTFAEEAVKINPDHIDSYFVLASIYAKQNNRKAFERIYGHVDSLIKKYRANPELFGGLVVNKIGEKWRLDLEYGNIFLADGLKAEAEKWIKKAADHAPSPSSVYRSAAINSREHGFIPLAEYLLEKAFNKGLDQQTAEFEKALNKRASGDVFGYRSIIQDLLDTEDINMPELMSALGTEALKIGKYQQAESLFTSAVGLSYHHPKLFTSLALACKYQNKIDEAINWNVRALEMEANDLDAMTNLGHIYFDVKKWDSSKSYYQKTLAIDNHQRDVLFRLSLIALMDKDLNKCIRFCALLLRELHIANDRVIKNIEDLAFIYNVIGKGFLARGEKQLHLEAMNFAKILEAG